MQREKAASVSGRPPLPPCRATDSGIFSCAAPCPTFVDICTSAASSRHPGAGAPHHIREDAWDASNVPQASTAPCCRSHLSCRPTIPAHKRPGRVAAAARFPLPTQRPTRLPVTPSTNLLHPTPLAANPFHSNLCFWQRCCLLADSSLRFLEMCRSLSHSPPHTLSSPWNDLINPAGHSLQLHPPTPPLPFLAVGSGRSGLT
jgi:hypothetical protein